MQELEPRTRSSRFSDLVEVCTCGTIEVNNQAMTKNTDNALRDNDSTEASEFQPQVRSFQEDQLRVHNLVQTLDAPARPIRRRTAVSVPAGVPTALLG